MVDLASAGKRQGFYSKIFDFMTKKYDIPVSIPAKPLLCTLNSGGFFYCPNRQRGLCGIINQH